jgi:hypothetical protein
LAQMYIEHHFASIRTSHSACICIAWGKQAGWKNTTLEQWTTSKLLYVL